MSDLSIALGFVAPFPIVGARRVARIGFHEESAVVANATPLVRSLLGTAKRVYYHPLKKRWYTRFQHNHVTYQRGYFDTFEEAVAVRDEMELSLRKGAQ